MNRNLVRSGVIVLAAGLLVQTAVLSGHTTVSRTRTPVIALVNEDQTATFNDHPYELGTQFVNLVSSDNKYHWQVVPRNVAENAYKTSSVDAVIYLPQSFSHDILTLQDIDPVKAEVDYKIRTEGTDLTTSQLQGTITHVLSTFNTQIVKMYYSSIAGNVAQAQGNMNSVVASQSTLLSSLSKNLYPSMKTTDQGYSTVAGSASALKEENTTRIAQQNSFTSSAKQTLDGNSTSLSGQLPSLEAYFASQKTMMGVNLANANKTITSQVGSDKDFYNNAFATYLSQLTRGNGTWTGLTGLSSIDSAGNPTGLLAGLQQQVTGYDTIIEGDGTPANRGIIGDLTDQVNQLESTSTGTGSIPDLEKLESEFLSEYAGRTLTVTDNNYKQSATTTYTKDDAANALVAKVQKSLSTHSTTVQNYVETIRQLVDTISTNPDDYTGLFNVLTTKSGLTAAQQQYYLDELNLIRTYDATLPGTVTPPSLGLIYPKAATNQSSTKTITVNVPAGQADTITTTQPSAVSVTPTLDTHCPVPTISDPTGCSINGNGAVIINNTAGTAALSTTITYNINFADTASTPSSPINVTFTSKTVDGTTTTTTTDSNEYILVPADTDTESIGGTDFTAITTWLARIDTASNLLLFLYGAPGQTLTDYTTTATTPGYSFTADPTSVYNRYDSLNPDQLIRHFYAYDRSGQPILDAAGNHVYNSDVDDFYTQGTGQIGQITNTITELLTARSKLQDDITTLSGANLPKNYFTSTINSLNNWYTQAMASITAASGTWNANSNSTQQLSSAPWQGQQAGKTELYDDQTTGDQLYTAMTQLVTTTSKASSSIAAAAQIIQDNSSQYDMLLKSVYNTKASARKVMTDTANTITTGTGDLTTSAAYNKNFGTVLSNTRTPGVNTNSIYDHFANPINPTNITPKATKTLSTKTFDYRWILVFIAGTLIGAALTTPLTRRRKTPNTGPTRN